MKFSQRFLSLLLCSVLLFSVSSVCVSAAEMELPPYHIYAVGSVNYGGSTNMGEAMIYPSDTDVTIRRPSADITVSSDRKVYLTMYIGTNEGNYLFGPGLAIRAVLENIYCASSLVVSGVTIPLSDKFVPQVSAEYVNGSIDYDVSEQFLTNSNGITDLEFSFTPQEEVSKIHITYTLDFSKALSANSLSMYSGANAKLYLTYGEQEGGKNFLLTVDQTSEEATLLDKILGKFQDLINSILSIPQKIWQFIENGLKNLFVPDEQYIVEYKERWTDFLSERLGAVWQVVDITFGAWEEIDLADKQDSIELPVVEIPLPEDNAFSFGGYQVKIVPTGFEWLADTLKWFTGAVCTYMFINGLRKRYDEIMGVEQ